MKLKAKKPVTHGGKTHQPGDVFDAPDHEAQTLIKDGHAEEHKEGAHGQSQGQGGQSQSGSGTSQNPPFSTGGKPSGS